MNVPRQGTYFAEDTSYNHLHRSLSFETFREIVHLIVLVTVGLKRQEKPKAQKNFVNFRQSNLIASNKMQFFKFENCVHVKICRLTPWPLNAGSSFEKKQLYHEQSSNIYLVFGHYGPIVFWWKNRNAKVRDGIFFTKLKPLSETSKDDFQKTSLKNGLLIWRRLWRLGNCQQFLEITVLWHVTERKIWQLKNNLVFDKYLLVPWWRTCCK